MKHLKPSRFHPELTKSCIVLTAAFVLSSIQRIWVHPSGSHTIRQAETIGRCIAFAEDLRNRGFSAFDHLIYPKVLQKGLLDGIHVTELPVIDLLGGFFFIGNHPWVGVFITTLFILTFSLWTAYRFLPQYLRAWNIDLPKPLSLILWLTGGTVAFQSNVIMPEGIAFPLMIIGIAYLLDPKSSLSRTWIGAGTCSLGIAMSPILVVTLGGLAPCLLFRTKNDSRWKRILPLAAASLLFPACWYSFHAHALLSFTQGLDWAESVHLITHEILRGQFPLFIGWIFIPLALAYKEWKLVLLYLISVLIVFSLEGFHTKDYTYSFISTCVFSIPLMAKTLNQIQKNKMLYRLSIFLLLWGVLNNIRGTIWVWARDSQYWQVDLWEMGNTARHSIPKKFHIVTDDGDYPKKLLFLGRSGTITKSNPYDSCNHPDYNRHNVAILSDQPFPLADRNVCQGRKIRTQSISKSNVTWYLTLAEKNDGS